MAKAKVKPSSGTSEKWNAKHRFRIGLIGKSPQRQLGSVYASNEEKAIEAAVVEFEVRETLRNKLIAQRDNL
jgi:hypothetical protein